MFIEISFFTNQLLRTLENLGFTQEIIFKKAGITEAMLTDNPIEKILLEPHQRLIKVALELSGDPAIFLKAGQYFTDFRELGMMGLMMTSCPSPLAALLQAQEMIETQDGERKSVIETHIQPEGDTVKITFTRQAPQSQELNWQLEATLVSLLNILTSITGHEITPSHVSFDYAPIATLQDYEKALKAPVTFEQAQTEIQFSQKIKNTPCLFSNQEINMTAWNNLMAENKMENSEQLKSVIDKVIWQMILERKKVTLPDIAKAMKFSVRTIQNRLQKEGTSFAELLAAVRFPEAKRMLAANKLTVESISHRLGYSEPTTFHNAFKEWQGETPGAYRKKLR